MLRRFFDYIDKVFDFSRRLSEITDARARPHRGKNNTDTLGQHWSLNHCYKHDPAAMVNFVLMLFIAFTLIQCFYQRNLKAPVRKVINSLIALANQLYAGFGIVVCKAAVRQSGAGPP